jgi:hypothetical protein
MCMEVCLPVRACLVHDKRGVHLQSTKVWEQKPDEAKSMLFWACTVSRMCFSCARVETPALTCQHIDLRDAMDVGGVAIIQPS